MPLPIADLDALAAELDEECARELAAAFLEDSGPAVAGIRSAIESEDAACLKMHAHALKGCCRTIKALDAEQVCSELEKMAGADVWHDAATLQSRLMHTYEELCAFVLDYLED